MAAIGSGDHWSAVRAKVHASPRPPSGICGDDDSFDAKVLNEARSDAVVCLSSKKDKPYNKLLQRIKAMPASPTRFDIITEVCDRSHDLT